MKLCKNLTSILVLAVAMMLIAGTAADAKTIKIRYAHVGVEGAPQTRYANELEKRIEKVTEGRVQVDVFPNGQLGGKQEMVDGVHIATMKPPIGFRGQALGQAYMSAAGVKGNLL